MATIVTKTIRSSGGDYSLLSSWEAAVPADLVTADEQWIAEIYDDWTNGATVNSLDFAARNTDATRKVVVKAPTGQEYDHTTGNGSKISCDGATYQIIVRALDIEFKNIGFHNPSSKTAGVFHKISGANLTVENCYANDIGFDKNSTAGATYNGCGIYLSNYTNYAIYGQIANSCTIVSKGGGAYSGDMIVRDSACTNVAIYNSTTKAVYNTYHNCTGDYNAQNNNGSLAPPGANSVSTVTTATFNNYAGGDYHLASDSTVLSSAGTNLYSDFTTDIDGDTWPSSGAWDIGFDYYVAAGGATYTLTTTTGSYTLTGNTVTLKANRKLSANTGAYTLTGNNTALTVNRKLSAVTGAYNLTGNNATLTYIPVGGYTLNVTTGAYTLTGNDAALKANRKLSATTGSYTLIGNDTTLTYNPGATYTLNVSTGTYTLTGNAATLTKGNFNLVAETGSYTLVGNNATLTYSALTADTWTVQTNNSDAWSVIGNSTDSWTEIPPNRASMQ